MNPFERLHERERLAELGGGEERLKKQHAQGKLTARERITRLFDAVIRVEAALKMNVAFGSPWASRVSVPVRPSVGET